MRRWISAHLATAVDLPPEYAELLTNDRMATRYGQTPSYEFSWRDLHSARIGIIFDDMIARRNANS